MLGLLVNHQIAVAFEVGGVILRDREFQLLELDRSGLLVYQADSHGYRIDDRLGPWRTAGNVVVHRDNLLDRADDRVGVEPDAATARAGADSEYQFGRRHGVIGPLQGLGGGAHGRALTKHHVCMARRTDQLDAEPLYI